MLQQQLGRRAAERHGAVYAAQQRGEHARVHRRLERARVLGARGEEREVDEQQRLRERRLRGCRRVASSFILVLVLSGEAIQRRRRSERRLCP